MLVNNSFQWSVCPLCKSSSLENIGGINYRQPVMFSTHTESLEKLIKASEDVKILSNAVHVLYNASLDSK
jgi:hypothetical protein